MHPTLHSLAEGLIHEGIMIFGEEASQLSFPPNQRKPYPLITACNDLP
jgi:hypothetical protein